MRRAWEFPAGLVLGAGITAIALLTGAMNTPARFVLPTYSADAQGLIEWVALNLGHSVWLFALVLVLYSMNLSRLSRCLEEWPEATEVVELDQLSDVWINLFIGIGVIWTAVGMRAALQAALGESSSGDSPEMVLRNLVDGGILLALTTTIVGAVGGYLMRLLKTLRVGARLAQVYEAQQARQLDALISATQRIERRLPGQEQTHAAQG